MTKRPGVLICGGRRVESTIRVVGRGYEKIGYDVAYLPTRDYDRPSPTSKFSPIENLEDALVGKIRSVGADLVVWVMCKSDYPAGLIPHLRDAVPHTRWGFHSFDDPFAVDTGEFERARDFDFAITCCESSIADYATLGVPAVCLYPPYDEDLQTNATPERDTADMSFIATNLYPPARFAKSLYCRADIVRAVAPLGDLALYGPWEKRYNWGGEFGVPELKGQWRGALRFEQLAAVYKSSRINLNSHVRPDGYLYLNERFTNVLGCGGFMLVDAVAGLESLQDGGEAFVIYRSLEDLQEKVRYFLAHETERRAIADRGLALARGMFSNTLFAERAARYAAAL